MGTVRQTLMAADFAVFDYMSEPEGHASGGSSACPRHTQSTKIQSLFHVAMILSSDSEDPQVLSEIILKSVTISSALQLSCMHDCHLSCLAHHKLESVSITTVVMAAGA